MSGLHPIILSVIHPRLNTKSVHSKDLLPVLDVTKRAARGKRTKHVTAGAAEAMGPSNSERSTMSMSPESQVYSSISRRTCLEYFTYLQYIGLRAYIKDIGLKPSSITIAH